MTITPMQIMLIAAIFLFGWLWSYLFIRQLMFNFFVANPLIKRMNLLREEMIAIGAKRYTAVSSVVCFLVAAILLFAMIHFGRLIYIVSFGVGALLALVLLIPKISPRNKEMFDAFCNSYYRFIPDDELRTAVFNKKVKQINSRLKVMHVSESFVPDFSEK